MIAKIRTSREDKVSVAPAAPVVLASFSSLPAYNIIILFQNVSIAMQFGWCHLFLIDLIKSDKLMLQFTWLSKFLLYWKMEFIVKLCICKFQLNLLLTWNIALHLEDMGTTYTCIL